MNAKMKSITLLVTLVLALPALAAAQESLLQGSELSFGKSGTQKVEIWTVVPLNQSEFWDICPFAQNDQPKNCKTTFAAEAFFAAADTPIDGIQSLGVVPGTLRPRKDGLFAFASGCIPLAASGTDYVVIVTEFAKKTCRKKINASSLIEFGVFALPTSGVASESGRAAVSFGPGISRVLDERPVQ